MKKEPVMKKFAMMLAGAVLLAAATPASAGTDRPVTVPELPTAAQEFLRAHFRGVEVSYALVDEDFFDKEYKVVFVNGTKVEFAKDGAWKEVDCKYGSVPASALPPQIADYVSGYFPGRTVVSLERGRRDYEVELDNGLELKFDLKFRMIEMDD